MSETPKSFLKNCVKCGKEIPIASEKCPFCQLKQELGIMSIEAREEAMGENFPKCPLCKSNKGYYFSGKVWKYYAQCQWCGAKWLLWNEEDKREMTLVYPSYDSVSRSYIGRNLIGKSSPVNFWKEVGNHAYVEKFVRELVKEQEIKQLKKKTEELSVLFSQSKISEESYKIAVKKIEENISELRSGMELSVVEKKFKPSALWWLVPFFFGILGGIIAYVGVKDDDKGMAENLLIFGILWSIILFIIAFIMLV